MKTLADAFEHALHDVYYAENAITKALPKVIDAVTNGELKTALKDHSPKPRPDQDPERGLQVARQESLEKCDAIEGLIKETDGVIKDAKGQSPGTPPSSAAARPSSTTRSRATERCVNGPKSSGNPKRTTCVRILDQRKAANHKLTHIALTTVNKPASDRRFQCLPQPGMTKKKPTSKKKLRVIMLADESLPDGGLEDFDEKQRELRKTEFDVRDAIEELGHEVFLIGVSDDLSTIRGAIDAHKPDIAFNLVEEFAGIGHFDQHVVSYSRAAQAAYTGCNHVD